ncbi:DUF4013 domain-containing protein [Candidatus Woesearchaeota archaeon]|nr:DUF4013 domain-containing protein [Candidatus Woesearchaeota archaeon]MBT7368437.1 DUF4013 domain-containing protein [Candidatus Woesearchaeota archaeon]
MDLFMKAFKRPFSDIKTLLIGCVLMFLGTIGSLLGVQGLNIVLYVIFTSLVLGYVYDCGVLSLKKNYSLPKWKEGGFLWIKGIKVLVLSVIWSVPVTVIYMLFLNSSISSSSDINLLLLQIPGYGKLIVAILFILTIYLVPAAVLNFIKTKKFKEGLNFKHILEKVYSIKYASAWFFSIFVFFSLYLTTFLAVIILGIIPLLGIYISQIAYFLFPSTIFISYVVGITAIGTRWNKL